MAKGVASEEVTEEERGRRHGIDQAGNAASGAAGGVEAANRRGLEQPAALEVVAKAAAAKEEAMAAGMVEAKAAVMEEEKVEAAMAERVAREVVAKAGGWRRRGRRCGRWRGRRSGRRRGHVRKVVQELTRGHAPGRRGEKYGTGKAKQHRRVAHASDD